MNLSIVIPAYNESQNIKATIEESNRVINKIPDCKQSEIIVVDDHSSDNTFETALRLNDPRVKVLRLSRNCGSHTAIRAAIKEASGDAVLFISADGQDDPSTFEAMLGKWQAGAKVVWALRKNKREGSWCTRKASRLFYKFLIWLGGAQATGIDISRANFCLFDRQVADAINNCRERNTSLFGLILWLGFNQDFVEYVRRPRRTGESKWNLNSSLRLAKDWIKGFSGLPLTLMAVMGFVVTLAACFYGIHLFWNFLRGNQASGESFIMLALLLVGGIQMIMLGIIGDYLWTNLDEARRRPLFLIEKRSRQ